VRETARKLFGPVALIGVAAVLAVLPLLGFSAYTLTFLTGLFVNVALAGAWTLLGGYAGYLSFGHVAFFGLGAYTTGMLLLGLGWSPFLTFPLGGLVAGVFALLIGYPTLRLRGPYFSVATLLVSFVLLICVKNTEPLGGATGLFLPFPDVPIQTNRAWFYWAMGGLAGLVTGALAWVERSKLGAGLAAIRENEDVAETVGVDTAQLKMVALFLSAVFTGLVGGVYSYMRSYLSPEIAFDVERSILMFLMALFGGTGAWFGPLVGASILTVVGEALTVTLGGQTARIMYGLLLMIVILFLPNGVLGIMALFRRGSALNLFARWRARTAGSRP
jgi:branched-chain amino acid transport system permease protein